MAAFAGLLIQKTLQEMGVFENFLIRSGWSKPKGPQPKVHAWRERQAPEIKAEFVGNGFFTQIGSFAISFNGEKNLGEIGPIKDYRMDYYGLSLRSYQSYIESEVTQIITNKFKTWVIGKGLKLQSEPATNYLKSQGINVDKNEFSKQIEEIWKLYSKSRRCSHSKMQNLNKLQEVAQLNATLGGDVLVLLRLDENNIPTVQLVDGQNVIHEQGGTEMFPLVLPNGNKVAFGVEFNDKREHVAYYIRKPGIVQQYSFETERIPALGKESGLKMAFMVYGLRYRIDSLRGIPMITVVLETLKKMERYKEATVGSAEERQKIVYQIVHQIFSDGSNPFVAEMAKAFSPDHNTDEIPEDVAGRQLADKVTVSTNKQTINMPRGQELKGLESKNELYFKDFYGVLLDIICAALEMPPNVALSKYDSNYSSSRAAIKDWEHILLVRREDFSEQFNQPIYNFALHIWIMLRMISAPGYLQAFVRDSWLVLEAYRCCRWIGAVVPHIDPLKEVQAARLKLGTSGAAIPLATAESATEDVGGGEYHSNVLQYAEELEESLELNIVAPAPAVAPTDGPKEEDK